MMKGKEGVRNGSEKKKWMMVGVQGCGLSYAPPCARLSLSLLALCLLTHLDQVVVLVPGQGGRPAVPANDRAVPGPAGRGGPVDAQAPARALGQVEIPGGARTRGASTAPALWPRILVRGVHGCDGGEEGGVRHAGRGRRRPRGVGDGHDGAAVDVALQLHARRVGRVGGGRGGGPGGGGAAIGRGEKGFRGFHGVVDLGEEGEKRRG